MSYDFFSILLLQMYFSLIHVMLNKFKIILLNFFLIFTKFNTNSQKTILNLNCFINNPHFKSIYFYLLIKRNIAFQNLENLFYDLNYKNLIFHFSFWAIC